MKKNFHNVLPRGYAEVNAVDALKRLKPHPRDFVKFMGGSKPGHAGLGPAAKANRRARITLPKA